jgi:hypothetical protein
MLNLSSLSYPGKASEAEESGDADGNSVRVLVLLTGHLLLLPGHQPAKSLHESKDRFLLHKLDDLMIRGPRRVADPNLVEPKLICLLDRILTISVPDP